MTNTNLINRPIQNFAFSQLTLGSFVYTTQNIKSGSSARNTYLGIYELNTTTKIATWITSIELAGYGHGESLEVTEKDSISEYIWVGSAAETETGSYYSTAISRLALRRVGVIGITETKTLKHLQQMYFELTKACWINWGEIG